MARKHYIALISYIDRYVASYIDNVIYMHMLESFHFHRWAVSTVMTRQNQIPAKDGSRATLGLIPLWDMCNHTNGIVSETC